MKQAGTNEKGKLWLKRETRPYRASILFLTCLAVFATVFSILFAYTVQYLINSASNKETKKLWIFAVLLLSFLLLKIVLKVLRGYYTEKANAKMTAQLRTRTYSKILRSDYASVLNYHSGNLITRLTTDINEVATYSVSLLPAIVGMVIQCVGSIAALITIDPLFTAIYIVAGVAFAGLAALFRKQLKKRHKDVLEADGESRSYMQESISSLLTLKAYGAEEKSTQKADGFAQKYYQTRMSRNTLRSGMNGVFSLLSNFGLIFAVVWCSVSVLNGNTDYGSILSAILLLMQLQSPLSSFSSIPPAYYARIASGERLSEIDEMPTEETTDTASKSMDLYKNMTNITLENVNFTYGRETVFSGAHITLEKGEIICLTGPSGAGKSTVFKLLLSVFKPTSGEIYLRGDFENTTKLLTETERALFAYVPQGNFLFSGTIYENLAFFANEMDENRLTEKMQNALKVACAEFVLDLPQGLQTVLTECGGGLSEGQLQRLAVARAILSDRPILLLDEATSALDADTERRLLENIARLNDKTCLIVTHRPKALEIADTVLLVENGKIIEQ